MTFEMYTIVVEYLEKKYNINKNLQV